MEGKEWVEDVEEEEARKKIIIVNNDVAWKRRCRRSKK